MADEGIVSQGPEIAVGRTNDDEQTVIDRLVQFIAGDRNVERIGIDGLVQLLTGDTDAEQAAYAARNRTNIAGNAASRPAGPRRQFHGTTRTGTRIS